MQPKRARGGRDRGTSRGRIEIGSPAKHQIKQGRSKNSLCVS